MDKLFNILNGLSMTDKALLVVLIGLVLLLIIMVIIFACTNKRNAVTDIEASLDFFDEIKKDNDNSKSVYVSDIEKKEEVKQEKALAVKIEDEPKPKMDLKVLGRVMGYIFRKYKFRMLLVLTFIVLSTISSVAGNLYLETLISINF